MYVPSKQELDTFYKALPDIQHKAFFMMLASSGWRLSELLNINLEEVDFEKRMLIPDCHEGATKHDYITFYNAEAEQLLKQYMEEIGVKNGRLFSINRRTLQGIWNKTARKANVRVFPQMLREWFCSEMLRKGTQEIYIDCFCGRIAKSVLARSYTDYSPDRLKEIYDRTELRVLS